MRYRIVLKRQVLVAYFSATGTTRETAKAIFSSVGGDLIEIKPVKPYTADGLNWNNRKSRTSIGAKWLGGKRFVSNDTNAAKKRVKK